MTMIPLFKLKYEAIGSKRNTTCEKSTIEIYIYLNVMRK